MCYNFRSIHVTDRRTEGRTLKWRIDDLSLGYLHSAYCIRHEKGSNYTVSITKLTVVMTSTSKQKKLKVRLVLLTVRTSQYKCSTKKASDKIEFLGLLLLSFHDFQSPVTSLWFHILHGDESYWLRVMNFTIKIWLRFISGCSFHFRHSPLRIVDQVLANALQLMRYLKIYRIILYWAIVALRKAYSRNFFVMSQVFVVRTLILGNLRSSKKTRSPISED